MMQEMNVDKFDCYYVGHGHEGDGGWVMNSSGENNLQSSVVVIDDVLKWIDEE